MTSQRGTFRRWVRNFADSEIPLPARIVVTLRNLSLRAVLRRPCCGHDGEPGC